MNRTISLSFFLLISYFILALFLFPALVNGMSDTYGHNPQHEFGRVSGARGASLLPFWDLSGDAFANEELIRLVPDRQSKKGAIWNTEPNRFQNWEVTYKFRIHGVSPIGADGIAFWYTKENGIQDDFFGFTHKFTGLGVILDTYDNDNTGLHPLLIAIINDGTKTFSHEHDKAAAEEESEMEMGNCQFHVRNNNQPAVIRISYRGQTLTVETADTEHDSFVKCLDAQNVDLPTGFHFGFSAATGALADNHDLYGFAVRNLDPDARAIDNQKIYGLYDKYSVTEQLSNIQYSVAQLKKSSSVVIPPFTGAPPAGRPAATAAPPASIPSGLTEKIQLIDDIGTAVLGINDLAEEIKNKVATVSQETGTVSKDVSGNKVAIDLLKKDVAQLLTHMRTLESNLEAVQRKVNERVTVREKGDSNFSVLDLVWAWLPTMLLSFGAVVLVIVVIVVVIIVWKVRADAKKRRF